MIVEVADTSLDYDRQPKLPRYAAGIEEVWIVDIEQQIVEQYSRPVHGQYLQLTKVLYGDTITAIARPMITCSTEQIF